MNKNRLFGRFLLVALVFVLCYVGGQWVSAESDAKTLEYKVVVAEKIFSREAYEALLNEHGAEGWVVDHVIPSEYVVVFRR